MAWCGKHSKTAVSWKRELFPVDGLYTLSTANLGTGGGGQVTATKKKNHHSAKIVEAFKRTYTLSRKTDPKMELRRHKIWSNVRQNVGAKWKNTIMIPKSDVWTDQKAERWSKWKSCPTNLPFTTTQWLGFHKTFDLKAIEAVSGVQDLWRTLLRGRPKITIRGKNLCRVVGDTWVPLLVLYKHLQGPRSMVVSCHLDLQFQQVQGKLY